MKHLVLLTALIALLSCGSDSNLITPDPSMDIGQPTEKNETPVMENPLGELPEVMVEPPIGDPPPIPEPPEVDLEALIEVILRELPDPPEIPVEPPEVIVIEPPEVDLEKLIEIIVQELPEAMPEPPADPPPDE